MAHLNLPESFGGSVELFGTVKAKDAADGASSVIRPFMTEQGIVLANDAIAVDSAKAIQIIFLKKEKDAEKHSRERDVLFEPRFKELRGSVQFLKGFYKKNVHKLGDWKITVDGDNRISYPADFKLRKKLVIDFLDVHDGFAPGTSPLQPYIDENGIDTVQMRLDAEAAEVAHDKFVQENKDKETARQQRDNFIEPVEDHLRDIGELLMKLFSKNQRKAGDWGYVVDDSNAVEKEKLYLISQANSKTIYKNVIGSVVSNPGTVEVTIYPGTDTAATPVVVPPNGSFVVKRRYGTFTAVNGSNTIKAELKATIRR